MKLARLPDGTPEIFHTLQGEGLSTGRPAVFVRTSLCNLHCVWCDTDYTWNWEGTPWRHERDAEPGYHKYRRDEQIVELSPDEVAGLVRAFGCRHLVLTGGEPLLQQEELAELMAILHRHHPEWSAEVETNGTLRPDGSLDALVTQYNVSPKLANSGNEEERRIAPEALAFFAESPKAWFKFVVADPEDLGEVEGLQGLLALEPDRIILMPEGRDPATLAGRRRWLAEQCRDRGFRYSDRLHLELWGSKRGK